ncbi:unnamed protein product [Durusdinium trenchii]|uniref:Uncharacterized protein n=1 Tax=Durusdinium trenchii TaxID=1381693 RepID=A0ABP0MYU8_9DINO
MSFSAEHGKTGDELGELLAGMFDSKPNAVLQRSVDGMTLAEMQQHVLRLASTLRVAQVGHVALCLHPGFGLVVSLVAVLWCGRAFVPLDPSYPLSRLQFILDDSEAQVLVSQREIMEVLHSLDIMSKIFILLIDSSGALVCGHVSGDTSWRTKPSASAYIIYTSGSTGVPKGVMVSRQNFANVLRSFKDMMEVKLLNEGRQPRPKQIWWIAHTTICFDIALLELFLPLVMNIFSDGLRHLVLELLDRSTTQNGDCFKQHLERVSADQTLTILQGTPSTFNVLRSAGWTPRANHLLLCGGEPFPLWLADFSSTSEIYNVYGPTETTIWSLVHHVRRAYTAYTSELRNLGVPIGQAIRHTTVQVDASVGGTDESESTELSPHATGSRGELVIGGLGVSLGYWKRPELTRTRFFEADGVRHFRTGDLVLEVREDGTDTIECTKQPGKLFCLGRLDQQVKLNGFRIELGEIETLLQSMKGIQQAAVQVRCNNSSIKVLVAYIVWKTATQIQTTHEMLVFLRKHLPDYMLPQRFVNLESLPMTLNGKIDRGQLPDPWEATKLSSGVGEANESNDDQVSSEEIQVERLRHIVLEVIQEVIAGRSHTSSGDVDVSTDASMQGMEGEHWRHLGLNSTMATSFSARLQERLQTTWTTFSRTPVRPSIMFECRTMSELVSHLVHLGNPHDPQGGQEGSRTENPLDRESTARTRSAPEGSSGARLAAPVGEAQVKWVRHVVSLGTLCMTAQAMEHWNLRRWPGPFDWIFSGPEMVTHCLAEGRRGAPGGSRSFATFLDASKYLAKPCNKAGHEVYSAMLQRDVIFNHHNPMLEKDYEFFVANVKSLQALMWSPHSLPEPNGRSPRCSSMVLFLLFNLERRVPLRHSAIQELFQELTSQCSWNFQLLVVQVHTKAAESPQSRLLEDRSSRNCSNLTQQLLVYELLCQGAHDGWRFSDEKDMQALGEIVLNGRDFRLMPAPGEKLAKCNTLSCPFSNTWLSTHCCHSCAKTSGSRHGDRCDGIKHHGHDDTQRPGEMKSVSTRSGTVSRAVRFQEALSKARELQRTAKCLQIQSSAVRKLRSVLPKQQTHLEHSSSQDCCHMESVTDEWQFLGYPLYADEGCRIWSPGASDLRAAFQTLLDWPRSKAPAFLLVEGASGQAALDQAASTTATARSTSRRAGRLLGFKANTDLFVANSSQWSDKLPRTTEEFVLFGHINRDEMQQDPIADET